MQTSTRPAGADLEQPLELHAPIAQPVPPADPAFVREVAALIVEALNLEIRPDEIAAETPLYGEGLGLDSIDILEIALVVSKTYGFQLRSDDENNARIYASLGSLAAHIAAHRTR